MTTYLLMIGRAEALRWILKERRMAFPPTRQEDALRLNVGDRLLLYTTRGAFRNPTRDRGRLIGSARVAAAPSRLDRPMMLAGREFTVACTIDIEGLAPYRSGLELAPLVPELDVFPDLRSWSARLRRTLVQLSSRDSALLRRKLGRFLEAPERTLTGYLEV